MEKSLVFRYYTQEQIDKFFQDMENPVPVPEQNVEAEGEESQEVY